MSFLNTLWGDVSSWFGGNSQPAQNSVANMAKKSPIMSREQAALNGDFDTATAPIQSYKKGGPVRKTGIYQLHKGEYVLNKKKAMAKKMYR